MRNRNARLGIGVATTVLALASTVGWAVADGGGSDGGDGDRSASDRGDGDRGDRDRGDRDRGDSVSERLTGYEEDPLVLSTTGHGTFRAKVDVDSGEIRWALRYSDLEGTVTQAHIHVGGAAQSGGISAFLCSNLPAAPAGTQACPPAPGRVSGVIRAAQVIGPVPQGIDAGQIVELLAALRADKTYVNVHSEKYPGGEIRAQLEPHH